MYSFSLISHPLLYYLVSRKKYEYFPSFTRKILPGILWPDYWPIDRESVENLFPERQSLVRTNLQFRYLYNFEEIFSQLSRDVIVMLTFGLSCPPLALLILFVLWIKYICSRIVLNRFLDSRWNLILRNSVKNWHASELISQQLFQQDPIIILLESSLSSISMAFEKCFPPILFWSTVFHSIICWDISVNNLSWKETIYIPIGMIIYCLFSFFILYHYHLGIIADWRMKLNKSKSNSNSQYNDSFQQSEFENPSDIIDKSIEIRGTSDDNNKKRYGSSLVSI